MSKANQLQGYPKDGTPFLAWYPKVRLDDDDEPTDEVIGGAWAIVAVKGREWDEPDWIGAHGSYFFEDWCFAELPTHWMPLPAAPGAASPQQDARDAAAKVALDIAKWVIQGDRPDEWKLKEWAETLDRDAIGKAYEWLSGDQLRFQGGREQG